jgi:hypothetical protein
MRMRHVFIELGVDEIVQVVVIVSVENNCHEDEKENSFNYVEEVKFLLRL